MSSKFPVLDNRPIDQWRVTELKEELKRRKLTVKGLKDDLVRRLDEALRNEIGISEEEQLIENEKDSTMDEVNGVEPEPESFLKGKDTETASNKTHVVEDVREKGKNDAHNLDSNVIVSSEGIVQDGELTVGTDSTEVLSEPVGVADSVQTNITVSENVVIHVDSTVQESQKIKTQIENDASSAQELQNIETQIEEDTKPTLKENSFSPKHHDGDGVLSLSDSNNQVSEVSPTLGFQVKSDSISTDSVSINEKNELKDSLNNDNCHIDIAVLKPEMVQPSLIDIPHSGGVISSPLDDQKPFENQGSIDVIDDTNVDLSKKNDNAEKLNLDRSSGDDSMEEDMLDIKQIDSNHNSDEVGDRVELDVCIVDEETVEATGGYSDKKDISTEKNIVAVPAEKRKLEDQDVLNSNEPPKRQRRWNSEALKVPEPQTSIRTPSTTPKDAFQPTIQKRSFTRSDSALSGGDTPKERIVPPSPKSPTTSLRIDRFLRPFTLKAVQELLAKTGSVSSFWMDHIKTHCYVTYSSVEEAAETRKALYNLQWPTNGGRLLVADFVDPQEVQLRTVAPPSPAATINTTQSTPTTPSLPHPSPRQHISKQQLPPPPPLPSNPPVALERVQLPPAPPLAKKPDPPIVTLDDLFRKTRTTPRIYYLPLSEEQVAGKLAALGKRT
ncbi:hypothetical protein GIB67_026081 [Kingdonia uniflora]|uniref:SAP domain-containing protein n=1 Tax=Kingdonia uniflora TaxID=39325 RepID=A0A7J7M2V7_9MAGN|nr:hypothetical protein GIB67_026081 [Kingdonia uniflora]